MLRMAQPCELASVRSGKPSIPERAPRTKELSSALERIEGDHPGLRFERPSHVLVSTPNGRAGELCVPHVCTRGFSRSSFFRLGDDVFFSKPELAFIQMATRIRNEVSLLELGWELCGSYQTRRTGASVGYDVEPLTSVRALRDYVACNSSLGGALLVGCGCAASHLELSAGYGGAANPGAFGEKWPNSETAKRIGRRLRSAAFSVPCRPGVLRQRRPCLSRRLPSPPLRLPNSMVFCYRGPFRRARTGSG